MVVVYDNWERLVTATLRREQLWQTALRTPSDLSSVSAASPLPSYDFSSNYGQASSLLVGDSFTYHQIFEATDYLHDSNLIKRGHSGDLYFGVLESGIEVVVKRVNVSSFEKELCFISEMEICGMIDHPRLIPLLGYCLENPDEKFLVYKHMPKKDLSRFLNGRDDDDRLSTSIDWTTRLKIATGAAEGLCYLHQYFPPLVHRDIQASSILLDDEFEVRLGSLTGICIEEKDKKQNRIGRFLRSPKGFEQSYSGASNATCAYDVYCFGKVLLEIVTGKLVTPANDSVMKDWLASTLCHIVADDKKLILNIVDSSLMMDEHILLEAWAVAFVAKACVGRNLSKRPQMAEILMALSNLARFTGGELQHNSHSSSVSSTPSIKQVPKRFKMIEKMTVTIKPDDISGRSTASRLKFDQMRVRKYLENNTAMELQRFSYGDIKKITEGFKEKVGEGGYGNVFKGKVSSDKFVGVKLLHKFIGIGEAFIREVAIMGIVHHVNVVRLLGFCADGFKRALVYEFMPNGSLAMYIYPGGRRNTLGLEMLQNIAIGIAQGMKYLQQGCQQRIVHYDIKPHNILLDDKFNPKIADFGLAKLFEEGRSAVNTTDIRGTAGYIAPEVFSRQFGNVSCKSDIYSFGMLLLEMLGSQRAINATVQNESELYLPEWVYQCVINEEVLRFQVEGNGEDVVFKKLAIVGLWCIQCYPEDRPCITSVLQMLEGNEENLSLPPNPFTSSKLSRDLIVTQQRWSF